MMLARIQHDGRVAIGRPASNARGPSCWRPFRCGAGARLTYTLR